VGPETVAEFLDIDPETVVRFARLGYLPAHPLHVIGKRTHWRFLLSEVRAAMLSQTNTYFAQHGDVCERR
jgi:helix-turn-helix protein